ncbi:MAG: hypothetical protein WBV82_30200, partial [Myxococcaceae bacterium]
WSGLSGWQNLNPTLSDNVESLHIANVDGLPGDDILRYVATSDLTGRWDISSGGRTGWRTLATFSWPDTNPNSFFQPARLARSFVGNFNEWNNEDILLLDHERVSRLFSDGHSNFGIHSMWHR